MELWRFYQHVWEAERALKAAVPTAWLVKGGVAFAVVRFPREPEPGERWVEKTWVAVPWVFGSGLFGVEVVFEDVRFTAVACPQHGKRLADVEGLHVLLNTEPVVGRGPRPGSRGVPDYFQYSIGDAIRHDAVADYQQPLELSILHWRCTVMAPVAASSRLPTSFNTPLEMRHNGREPPGAVEGLSILHWRCADCRGRTLLHYTAVTFNTPLEMQKLKLSILRAAQDALSILHWRCKMRLLCGSAPVATTFQYSIGDAVERGRRSGRC